MYFAILYIIIEHTRAPSPSVIPCTEVVVGGRYNIQNTTENKKNIGAKEKYIIVINCVQEKPSGRLHTVAAEGRRRRHVDKWCTAAFTHVYNIKYEEQKKNKNRHAPNRFNVTSSARIIMHRHNIIQYNIIVHAAPYYTCDRRSDRTARVSWGVNNNNYSRFPMKRRAAVIAAASIDRRPASRR